MQVDLFRKIGVQILEVFTFFATILGPGLQIELCVIKYFLISQSNGTQKNRLKWDIYSNSAKPQPKRVKFTNFDHFCRLILPPPFRMGG